MPFKAFLSSPELRAPRGTDRKLSPLLSPLQDPLADKTLLEPREMVRPKKVCFSESSLPSGDRTRRSYYLNGMAPRGVGAGAGTGVWWQAAGGVGEGAGGPLAGASPFSSRGRRVWLGGQGLVLLPLKYFISKKMELLSSSS